MDFSDILNRPLAWYRAQRWEQRRWVPSAALFERAAGGYATKYTGQPYDFGTHYLEPEGWGHDHCAICWTSISDAPGDSPDGYVSGSEWLCPTCYQRWIATDVTPAT